MSAQRSRFFSGLVCLILGLVILLGGWLLPVYLHGVDVAVLHSAGQTRSSGLASRGPLALAQFPDLASQRVASYFIRPAPREKALHLLGESKIPAVQALLRCRQLTNTVLFPPSASASGQAFDAAVAISGLLVDADRATPELSQTIYTRALSASRGGSPQPVEEILMDELSLAQRFDWTQLVVFTEKIQDPMTLALLADAVRNSSNELSTLYDAVALSQRPAAVAHYISEFSQSGLRDLAVAEREGDGAVEELLTRNQRIFDSSTRHLFTGRVPFGAWNRAGADFALRRPAFALTLKWGLYFIGGFLVAAGWAWGRAGRVNFARETLVAAGILFFVLLLSEPFIAQESQRGEFPFRLRLPSAGHAAVSQIIHAKPSIMNTPNMTASLLTLLLFFVLQALIYLACLSRLNETLRQNVPARFKLKLLENEEHLFDAGLYLGFVGTIICLILVSLGVLQFSLMAAYSSTSFGIIFVSVLKIFKVRPARRRLLLQAEQDSGAINASSASLATAP